MLKAKRFFGVLLAISLILAVVFSVGHLYFFGSGFVGIRGETQPGFSIGGLAIGEPDVGEHLTGYAVDISTSQIIVISEWVLALIFLVIFYSLSRAHFRKEVMDIKTKRGKRKKGNSTDLDKLHEILKKKKRVRFMAIEEAFDVNQEIVKNWSKTLELGNIATIDYPRIGEPELVLVEKKSNEEG
jgi:hypothetical protein